jgi:hypothetical protein
MNLVAETSSSQIVSEFKRAALVLRPKPGLTTMRCSLSHSISLSITNLIQSMGFNRRILAKSGRSSIILNIGCADHLDPRYLNADVFPPVGRTLRLLAGDGRIAWDLFINIVCQDTSLIKCADGIVFAHVLEHIPADKALVVLENCFQYLKPGGQIRLSVPHIRAYPYQDSSSPEQKAMDAIARNHLIYCHFHQYMYEPELLIALLREVGFCDVQQANFGQGVLADSDRLERRDESIYVTAFRPL